MNKLLAAFALLIAASTALGDGQSFVADTQRFGVRLFLVPSADAFVAMWSKPETPKLSILHKIDVNAKFAGVILYWGGGADANGYCNIQLQTQVIKSGSILVQGAEMPMCSNHQPPLSGVLALSDTIIDFVASGEPSGLIVRVTVTDKINNETLSVDAPIEVLAR